VFVLQVAQETGMVAWIGGTPEHEQLLDKDNTTTTRIDSSRLIILDLSIQTRPGSI
jgi:hypothetical protein